MAGCELGTIRLPKVIEGSLDLSGCDITNVVLPERVGTYLDITNCRLVITGDEITKLKPMPKDCRIISY